MLGLTFVVLTDAPIVNGMYRTSKLFVVTDSFYVTWGAQHNPATRAVPGQPLPPHGKPLGKLNSADLKDVIKKV